MMASRRGNVLKIGGELPCALSPAWRHGKIAKVEVFDVMFDLFCKLAPVSWLIKAVLALAQVEPCIANACSDKRC